MIKFLQSLVNIGYGSFNCFWTLTYHLYLFSEIEAFKKVFQKLLVLIKIIEFIKLFSYFDMIISNKLLCYFFLFSSLLVSTWKTHNPREEHKAQNVQKQPLIVVPGKRCSENMQQLYRRTPMLKCNFTKVALQLYWNRPSAWVFSCKFAAYFQNTFS